jgi:hypothetical protein
MQDDQNNSFVSDATASAATSAAEPTVMPDLMTPSAARQTVTEEISRWEGVTVYDHGMGGVAFRFERRELGHLHGIIADFPFPRRIRDELVAAGRARPHHVLPESGWVTVPMRTSSEVAEVIALFRQNYDRARAARAQGQAQERYTSP